MGPDRAAFFLLAGNIQNELNSLSKIFSWCLSNSRQEKNSEIESLANGMQAMIYARARAGKLTEAWGALKKGFFSTKLAQQVEDKLNSDSKTALGQLKSYFNKDNPISRVRNSFAFHYSIEEFRKHWAEVADKPFEIILGDTIGNNLYVGSELVVANALFNAVDLNKNKALEVFYTDIQTVSNYFTDFLEGAILAILEEHISSGLATVGLDEEIQPTRSANEMSIPFFCKPND